ncbi:MAG: DUF5050 domain-containing protein [Clostridia bacterium]|nr:DUF5050 domain-containing protein [Clostridia bacterium]
MRIDLSCPVENRGTIVKTNSETGEQYLLLKLLNISEKTITSVNFNVKAYDENGTELGVIPVELTELEANPKDFFAENKAISLADFPEAKNFVVEVTHATFIDEEPYTPSDENTIEFDNKEASVDDVIALREFAPVAVCFAQNADDHWKCVCGRPNFLDSENCVRCGIEKEKALSKFSSRDALDKAIEEVKQAEEQAAIEAEELAAEKLAAKKAKQKKALVISGAVVAGLIVLAALGFFGRIVYYNIAANQAVKNGDYTKAYDYYLKSGSSKINDVADLARGNTPSNLMFQGGICTEDNENFYFLTLNGETYHFNLIKENKKTKKKEILTDSAAGSLCAVGDYIYFMDSETSGVKRITKDGKNIDTIIQTPVKHIDVIGNTLYYIQTDYDNPDNLTLEQCQTLASQGQMKTFDRIHKMDINKKSDTLLSKDGIQTCAIYGNCIYYLSAGEETWDSGHLKVMDLNGKNVETIISSPVATFTIMDNNLYYVPLYNEAIKGSEITSVTDLDYRLIRINLDTNETDELNTEFMTLYINQSKDSVLSVVVNRAQYIDYYNSMFSGNSEATVEEPSYSIIATNINDGTYKYLVTGDVQIFNVSGDEIICYLASQGICRLKIDGSDFEPVYADGTSTPPEELAEEELSDDLQALADDINNSKN